MYRKNLSLSECEIKLDDAGATFEGYASVFGGTDSYGDTIEPGAFTGTLRTYGAPKMFFNHASWELPIGAWKEAQEDERGLRVRGEFTPGNRMAEDVRAALRHGTVDGLSIGFYLKSGDFKEQEGGGRVIKRVSRLVEVSVVTFPADGAARVDLDSVKSELDEIETVRDFERFLRDAGGLSKGLVAALTTRAKVVFGRGDPGEAPDAKAMRELHQQMARLAQRVGADHH